MPLIARKAAKGASGKTTTSSNTGSHAKDKAATAMLFNMLNSITLAGCAYRGTP